LEDGFTVKFCYNQLSGDMRFDGLTDLTRNFVFSNVWKCAAPSNCASFFFGNCYWIESKHRIIYGEGD
jgi:hypothetical protein